MVNWMGGDGTLWATGSNWAGGSVPAGYDAVDIAQTGTSPVLVMIAAGQSESGNPLTLGAAGSVEAVTLIDDGSLSNYDGVTLFAGTTIDDAGSMTWSTGGYDAGLIDDTGSFNAAGNVTVAAGGTLDIAAGGVASVATTLTVNGTLIVDGDLSISSGIAGTGTVIVDGGTLNGGSTTALALGNSALTFIVENGGSLHVTAPSPGTSFTLESTGNTLDIAQYGGTIEAPITGLGVGDALTVGNADSGTVESNGNGSDAVVIGGVTLSDVTLEPGLTANNTTIDNGTVKDPTPAACYLAGTRLRTPRGDVAVEALREGDLVLTASGRAAPILWIGRRRYDAVLAAMAPTVHPILFRAGALGPGVPARDLRVSPLHAMVLDGTLVPAMLLVNGVSVVQERPTSEILYFHIELDRHDVLLAEGTAAESFRDENSRDMFDNARAWHGRAAIGPACAPKVEHGFALEAMRARIEARAGIAADGGVVPGALLGGVDLCRTGDGGTVIGGWARDASHPDAPVCLTVIAGGRVVGDVLANRYRGDLAAAGVGHGRHAFAARIAALPAGAAIELRRAADGALLAAIPMKKAA
jgi:hypothetical protein